MLFAPKSLNISKINCCVARCGVEQNGLERGTMIRGKGNRSDKSGEVVLIRSIYQILGNVEML
jgi:hypothetical protein